MCPTGVWSNAAWQWTLVTKAPEDCFRIHHCPVSAAAGRRRVAARHSYPRVSDRTSCCGIIIVSVAPATAMTWQLHQIVIGICGNELAQQAYRAGKWWWGKAEQRGVAPVPTNSYLAAEATIQTAARSLTQTSPMPSGIASGKTGRASCHLLLLQKLARGRRRRLRCHLNRCCQALACCTLLI